MIRLPCQVGRKVIVLVFFECVVAEVAPQNRSHAKFVRMRKRLADFDNLPPAVVGTEINRGADRDRTHVVRLLDGAKKNLIRFVGEGEQFVVIDLHKERKLVRVLARDGAQHAQCGRDGVALSFDRELYDVLAVEIFRIFREACACRMLDALVHWQNRKITGAAEPPGVEHAMQAGQHARVAIGDGPDAVQKIRTRQVQVVFRNLRRLESEQGIRPRTQVGLNRTSCCGSHCLLSPRLER